MNPARDPFDLPNPMTPIGEVSPKTLICYAIRLVAEAAGDVEAISLEIKNHGLEVNVYAKADDRWIMRQ